MNEAQWAALSALVTAACLKGIDWWQSRTSRSISQRKDLREEVAELWKKIDSLEAEVDDWRKRYWALVEQNSRQQGQIDHLAEKQAKGGRETAGE